MHFVKYRYVDYWRPKFRSCDLKEFCFVMEAANEEGVKEQYFMLAHELPEDQNLRDKLQKERLVSWVFSPYMFLGCLIIKRALFLFTCRISSFGSSTRKGKTTSSTTSASSAGRCLPETGRFFSIIWILTTTLASDCPTTLFLSKSFSVFWTRNWAKTSASIARGFSRIVPC